MTTLMILGAALIVASVVVVYAALVMGSKCDEQEELLRFRVQQEAIERAVRERHG
jgi:hypothetical protein